ncbi:hypothetical protein ACYSNM_12665 [Myroides sp. LJL116]
MKKMFKSLFLPLAVFAMLGLGALTLSASNITADSVTSTEAVSMQAVYTGPFFTYNGVTYDPISVTPNHCTITPTDNGLCKVEIEGEDVYLYGRIMVGTVWEYKPLYNI